MVQSGKTANMLSLMSLGLRAGYRLFIILAGDKSSLRDQTQSRVNTAFNLDGGVNNADKILSHIPIRLQAGSGWLHRQLPIQRASHQG